MRRLTALVALVVVVGCTPLPAAPRLASDASRTDAAHADTEDASLDASVDAGPDAPADALDRVAALPQFRPPAP